MNEIVLANLLFQAGASTALMVVAGISAARQLHVRRSAQAPGVEAAKTSTVIDLPAARSARALPAADLDAHSKAA